MATTLIVPAGCGCAGEASSVALALAAGGNGVGIAIVGSGSAVAAIADFCGTAVGIDLVTGVTAAVTAAAGVVVPPGSGLPVDWAPAHPAKNTAAKTAEHNRKKRARILGLYK